MNSKLRKRLLFVALPALLAYFALYPLMRTTKLLVHFSGTSSETDAAGHFHCVAPSRDLPRIGRAAYYLFYPLCRVETMYWMMKKGNHF